MRMAPISCSLLQVPGCRIHTLASSWWKSFRNLHNTSREISRFKVIGTSHIYGGYSRKWIRTPLTTKTEERKNKEDGSELGKITQEILDETVSAGTKLSVNKSEIGEFQRIQYFGIHQKIADENELASPVTAIVFDLETTGFCREGERIIEIALQVLRDGEDSTFQTLVNPGRYVPNSRVHGITSKMVNRSEVPRMEELIPLLLQYVQNHQTPGGYVLWIAHNARCFDVPFLVREFIRCSTEIPSNWRFVDTLALAREVMKSRVRTKLCSKISLEALREHYGIPLIGSAHRAMADVNTLKCVLRGLTNDLKLSLPALMERSFSISDLRNAKKKKA